MLQVEAEQREAGRVETPCERSSVEHKVKSWPHLFEATLAGTKTHEMRKATERDYRVGDTLKMHEYDPSLATYTGRELVVRITYITSPESPCALSRSGLHPDYCILSIAKLP
jgi:Domain of unknown function (DUF3850)